MGGGPSALLSWLQGSNLEPWPSSLLADGLYRGDGQKVSRTNFSLGFYLARMSAVRVDSGLQPSQPKLPRCRPWLVERQRLAELRHQAPSPARPHPQEVQSNVKTTPSYSGRQSGESPRCLSLIGLDPDS